MMGQKASRLFYQVARGIKVTESTVDLSTTLAEASSSLRLLIEGHLRDDIPPPPTQQIATELTYVWEDWHSFEIMLTEYGNSGKIKAEVLLRSARMSREVLSGMNKAVDHMTEECLRVMPGVHPVEMSIAAMQLKLMQQMSKESILVVKEFELDLVNEAKHNQHEVEVEQGLRTTPMTTRPRPRRVPTGAWPQARLWWTLVVIGGASPQQKRRWTLVIGGASPQQKRLWWTLVVIGAWLQAVLSTAIHSPERLTCAYCGR